MVPLLSNPRLVSPTLIAGVGDSYLHVRDRILRTTIPSMPARKSLAFVS